MSELYELPEGWKWKRLESIVRIGCERGFKPTVTNNKVPFIGMKDIDEYSGRNTKYIFEENSKVSKGKTKFQKNAILLGKITPCTQNNKTTIVPNDIDGGYATTEVYALHCLEKIIPLYLNYYIRSQKINKYLVDSMIGATGRQRVPSEVVKNLNIPLPPLKEQKRIVAKLDTLFTKIDKAIALHQQNIDEAEALMGSVLDEVFGELEGRYEKTPLSSFATFQNGFAFKSKDFNKDGIGLRVIRIGNVLDLEKNPVYIKEKKEYEKYLLKEHDIVISMTGTRRKKDYLFVRVVDTNNSYLNQRVGRITHNEKSEYKFLYYFFKSDIFRDNIFEFETGTVNQGNISSKDIMNSLIVNAPLKTQQKTVQYLDQISQKIEALKKEQQEKMQSLKDLKASLLDKAFKGEL